MFKLEALNRKYCSGETEVATFRFPKKLKHKIQAHAELNGRSTTDVVITVLDQFVQAIEAPVARKKVGKK